MVLCSITAIGCWMEMVAESMHICRDACSKGSSSMITFANSPQSSCFNSRSLLLWRVIIGLRSPEILEFSGPGPGLFVMTGTGFGTGLEAKNRPGPRDGTGRSRPVTVSRHNAKILCQRHNAKDTTPKTQCQKHYAKDTTSKT
jgi:hypothetical protein